MHSLLEREVLVYVYQLYMQASHLIFWQPKARCSTIITTRLKTIMRGLHLHAAAWSMVSTMQETGSIKA